ncbi:MAG: methyltransferase domain-containing protein [Myxococcales bacterium]|nr:methyltransferase domain-containing protein [Myxococcales bacterium]
MLSPAGPRKPTRKRGQLDHQGFAVSQNLDAIPSNRSFDAVLLIEVIEHVPDPAGFCNRLRVSLDPKGRIFLATLQGPRHLTGFIDP